MVEDLRIYNEIKITIERKIYFYYHLFIFIIVNLILYLLNRYTLSHFHWQNWIILCWGLGVYFNFIAAVIFNPLNFRRWRQYLRRRGQEKSFIDFLYHLHIYIGINTFLLLLNKLTSPVPWSIYPFFFWGLGLAIHFILVKYLPRKKLLELGQQMKNNELFEAKIHLLIHSGVFIFFNILILVINLIVDRRQKWFIYPLIGWGLGLFFHSVWIFLNKSHRLKKYKQKKGIELLKYYR